MANQAGTPTYLPHGLNESRVNSSRFVLPGSLAAADTVTLQPIPELDASLVPVYAIGVKAGTPKTYQALTMTSISSAGVLVVTVPAGGSMAAGDEIYVDYRAGA